MSKGTGSVQILRWPAEEAKREWCRQHRIPRLLLVEMGDRPPVICDVYEDWVRPPLPQADLDARIQVLQERHRRHERPSMVGERDLVFRSQRITTSRCQAALARELAENYQQLVERETLAAILRHQLEAKCERRNVLDLHMTRLRRKLKPLGLEITTIWGSGYQLNPSDGTNQETLLLRWVG